MAAGTSVHSVSQPPKDPSASIEAALGAAAGAAAVWLMDRVGWAMYRREDPAALRRELQARPEGLDSAHLLARKLGRAVGRDPGTKQPNAAGVAVHYALGALPGAAYALARRRFPVVARGAGLPFGLALFVVNDEIAAPLLGLARGPRAYPVQSHVRGLVAHLALGVGTDRLLVAGLRARFDRQIRRGLVTGHSP